MIKRTRNKLINGLKISGSILCVIMICLCPVYGMSYAQELPPASPETDHAEELQTEEVLETAEQEQIQETEESTGAGTVLSESQNALNWETEENIGFENELQQIPAAKLHEMEILFSYGSILPGENEELLAGLTIRNSDFGIAAIFYSIDIDGVRYDSRLKLSDYQDHGNMIPEISQYEQAVDDDRESWNLCQSENGIICEASKNIIVCVGDYVTVTLSYVDVNGNYFTKSDSFYSDKSECVMDTELVEEDPQYPADTGFSDPAFTEAEPALEINEEAADKLTEGPEREESVDISDCPEESQETDDSVTEEMKTASVEPEGQDLLQEETGTVVLTPEGQEQLPLAEETAGRPRDYGMEDESLTLTGETIDPASEQNISSESEENADISVNAEMENAGNFDNEETAAENSENSDITEDDMENADNSDNTEATEENAEIPADPATEVNSENPDLPEDIAVLPEQLDEQNISQMPMAEETVKQNAETQILHEEAADLPPETVAAEETETMPPAESGMIPAEPAQQYVQYQQYTPSYSGRNSYSGGGGYSYQPSYNPVKSQEDAGGTETADTKDEEAKEENESNKDTEDKKNSDKETETKDDPEGQKDQTGSVYDLSELEGVTGKYLTEPQQLVIYETNKNKLVQDSIKITVSRDTESYELDPEQDYSIKMTGNGTDRKIYKYVINSNVFSEDGKYRIFITSKDEAGNENFNEDKNAPISFWLDRTEPLILSCGETEETVENGFREIRVRDNMDVEDVKVFLGDTPVELESDGEIYRFAVPGDITDSDVRVVAADKAGNIYERTLHNYVHSASAKVKEKGSGSIWILCLCAAAAAAGAAVIYWRKKHKE